MHSKENFKNQCYRKRATNAKWERVSVDNLFKFFWHKCSSGFTECVSKQQYIDLSSKAELSNTMWSAWSAACNSAIVRHIMSRGEGRGQENKNK